MNTKWKVLAGSLPGAVAIHAFFAGCGSHGASDVASGGGHRADSGLLDALVDVLTGNDASAAPDGGPAPACTAWQVTGTAVYSATVNLPSGQEPSP